MTNKTYTYEQLKEWSPDKLLSLYNNAKKHINGQYIIDIIEKNGLPLSSGGLSYDDPIHRKIVEIAWSPEGKQAAIDATNNGFPALCGVDRLLQNALGSRYSKHDLGTASAGSIVAEVMRNAGYKEGKEGKCPEDCTAKSGMKWLR